jgi:NADH-quinone oxidoreductase subunit L
VAVAVVFLPLLAAAIAGFFGRAIGFRASQLVTCGAMLVSMALGILLFTSILTTEEPQIIPLATWIAPAALTSTGR